MKGWFHVLQKLEIHDQMQSHTFDTSLVCVCAGSYPSAGYTVDVIQNPTTGLSILCFRRDDAIGMAIFISNIY